MRGCGFAVGDNTGVWSKHDRSAMHLAQLAPLAGSEFRRVAAVDRDRRAGDEIRGRRGEEHRDAGEVVGHAPAPGRGARQDPLVQPVDLARASRVSSVSIQPGSTALTWMLSLAQAVASDLVICTMPPLLDA